MKVTSENENKKEEARETEEKEFIVEVEVIGSWVERYSVFATSADEAEALWDGDEGEYIESMDYQPSSSEPIQVYEY